MLYPIRAVAKLTGLSIDTLRAWERRYGAVEPQRDDRGRLYSESDVRRLHLLRTAVERGHAIGRLAGLSDGQLKDLLAYTATVNEGREALAAGVAPGVTPRRAVRPALIQGVMASIERFDYAAAERELARMGALLSPRELVHEVAQPLMLHIGDEWHAGRLGIAQEHMGSSLLRNLLGALVRLYVRNDPPTTLLLTTPSDERHEFGILLAAMLAAGGGLGIVYLGTDLPADEVVRAAARTRAGAVVLGMTGSEEAKKSMECFGQVARELPEETELWVGGLKSEELVKEVKKTRALVIEDFPALEKHLIRLGAQF
jgi:DNA-binding transcriptional MerR regulator/methylmalonyl-CoA mutase cobalamin-binding subunit